MLSAVETKCGGMGVLGNCNGRMSWPRRGVYFFFEPCELRAGTGTGLRVVRVGTHAVSRRSKSTLWGRLSQHRGKADGAGGNHRGSVFRLLLGAALAARDPRLASATWGVGQSAAKAIRDSELKLEARVSKYIGKMPFIWLECDDEPSPESQRMHIERNAIALLSQATMPTPLDPPSQNWLGTHSPNEHVRRSGLWNSRHVLEGYDSGFLDSLEGLVVSQQAKAE
jgi:hypothetical protein